MKRLVLFAVLWFAFCVGLSICAKKACGYTYDGAIDPQTFSQWEVVPKHSNPPIAYMLRNPDCTAEIKLAIVILAHQPVQTENGLEIMSVIYKYCYFKDNEVFFFTLNVATGKYECDANITPEIREQIRNLFRQAFNGKDI